MLRGAAFCLFAAVLSAQTLTILTESEMRELESRPTLASDSQKLLGQNYAFVLLGVTRLDALDTVAAVDAAKATGAFAQHVREALDHSSQAVVLGEAGETLWTYSSDVEGFIVRKARETVIDTTGAQVLAVRLIDRAVAVDPTVETWRRYRIPITILRAYSPLVLPLSNTDAYASAKADLAVLSGMNRIYSIGAVAKCGVRAGALDDAESLGREMLQPRSGKVWNAGNLYYDGNMVLGQVAVRRGDMDAARKYLLESAHTPGSPNLNSFGPNMSLARDVLKAHGDRATVVEFFDLCRTFWTSGGQRLDTWTAFVNRGSMPDFGASLNR